MAAAKALSKKQKETYDFVMSYIEKNDCTPTCAEIAERFGLKEIAAAQSRITMLVNKGWLEEKKGARGGIQAPSSAPEEEVCVRGERYKVGSHGFVFRWNDGWFRSSKSPKDLFRAKNHIATRHA